jgi:uncharacterized protein YjbI with pentapeptide repeats
LSGANLSWANLSAANLSWANLSGANLSGADLSGANLSGADLSKANLIKADLRWADLSEADLRWADLSEADLSEANLSEANLSGADLRWANLSEANLSEANLDFSSLPLWCGSLKMKTDTKQRKQIAYHLASLFVNSEEPLTDEEKQLLDVIKPYANQFHRVDECGRILEISRKKVIMYRLVSMVKNIQKKYMDIVTLFKQKQKHKLS